MSRVGLKVIPSPRGVQVQVKTAVGQGTCVIISSHTAVTAATP